MFAVALPNPAKSSGESVLVRSMITFSSVETVPLKDLQLHFMGWGSGFKETELFHGRASINIKLGREYRGSVSSLLDANPACVVRTCSISGGERSSYYFICIAMDSSSDHSQKNMEA